MTAPANAPANTALTPDAALAKHTKGSDEAAAKDAALVAKIEAQIANSPIGWLQGLGAEADAKQGDVKSGADGKLKEFNDEVNKNKDEAPPDAGPPPKPSGTPAKPQVPAPKEATKGDGGGKEGAKKAGGGGDAKKPAKAGGKAPSKGGAANAGGGGDGLATAVLAKAGGGDIDAALDAYEPKAAATKETVSKIGQMRSVADGFKGQLDVYLSDGSTSGAIAEAANWIGAGKDVAVILGKENPYAKSNDTLGKIASVVNRIKTVASLVGSITGKIGMVLTVVGLLGMIFPPIGSAVSAVARILNLVSIICDVIAFALSGVLVGLNGVRLAKMIANGGSPEEKAATADMMMSEANSASGSLISLAMQFGPKFMKGFLGKSKGILSGLFKKAKAYIGKIAGRVTGKIKEVANKVLRKMGLGGVRGKMVDGKFVAESTADTLTRGQASRLQKWGAGKKEWASGKVDALKNSRAGQWTSQQMRRPSDYLYKKRNELLAKHGNSEFAKKLDRFAARTNRFGDRIDLERGVERLGEKIGGIGSNPNTALGRRSAQLHADADRIALEAQQEARQRTLEEAQRLGAARKARLGDDAGTVRMQTTKGTMGAYDRGVRQATASRTAAEAAEEARKLDRERMVSNPAQYADDAAAARVSRAQMELDPNNIRLHHRRKELQGIANPTTQQKSELTRINNRLKPLDEARRLNNQHHFHLSGEREKTVAGIGSNPWEIGERGFKMAGSINSTIVQPIAASMDPSSRFGQRVDEGASWGGAESYDFSKVFSWNQGSATSGAQQWANRDAAQHTTAVATAPDTTAQQFREFVQRRAQRTSIANNVRALLSGIPRRRNQGTSSAATTPGQATQTNSSSTSTSSSSSSSSSSSTPTAPADAAPSSTPPATAPTTPAPASTSEPGGGATTAASTPGGGGDSSDAGAPELPYWPSLLSESGEFGKALKDFGDMRRIAIEFKRGQVSAKQKAVDTLAVYGKYEEYAAARRADAQQNAQASQDIGNEAQQNVGAAGKGEESGGKGADEQGKARGTAGQRAAVDLPEPEVRGFWGRIVGRIKRWAKQKAAEVLGWIQEKIASLILKGLCGVSMGDLKAYTTALKNQQARAKGVAVTGEKTSQQATGKVDELKATANKETASAIDAISECDQNISDADMFLQDVNDFEQQIKAEAEQARQFIEQVRAEVQTMREQQQAAERAAQEQAAQQAAQQDGEDQMCGPDGDHADGDQDSSDMSMDEGDSDHENEEENEEDSAEDQREVAAVQSAIAFVRSSGDTAATQMEAKRDDYKNQIVASTTNRKDSWMGLRSTLADSLGPRSDQIIAGFRSFISETEQDLQGQTRDLTQVTDSIVDAIISAAEGLDEQIQTTHQALDDMFTSTYDEIRQSSQRTGMLDLDRFTRTANDLASPVDTVTNKAIDYTNM